MTRLQKKCFVFSMGLHGLLAATLIVSAGFSSRPEDSGLQVLSMIPANILDGAGAHGGTPAAAAPRMVMPATEPEIVGRSPISKPKEEEVVRPQTLPPPTQARIRFAGCQAFARHCADLHSRRRHEDGEKDGHSL